MKVAGNWQMDDKEIQEFLEMYGNKLPNPEHCPKEFAYYVKLYKHIKSQEGSK